MKVPSPNRSGLENGRASLTLRGLVFAIGLLTGLGVHAAEVGNKAPSFAVVSLTSNETVSLDDFKGKVVILDFWASWCGPCLVAMPKLSALSDSLPNDKATLLAISVDSDPRRAKRFMTKMGATYDSLIDPEGDVAGMYDLPGIPTTFVIDQEGKITAQLVGLTPGDEKKLLRYVATLYDND